MIQNPYYSNKYLYSSLYLKINNPNRAHFLSWTKGKIRDDDLYISMQSNSSYGREDNPHITILYGILQSEITDDLPQQLKPNKFINIELGKTNLFLDNDKFDVLVIDVKSDTLNELYEKASKTIEHCHLYQSFKPHITLAYLKKGRGWRYFDKARWNKDVFTCNTLVFSSNQGHQRSFII